MTFYDAEQHLDTTLVKSGEVLDRKEASAKKVNPSFSNPGELVTLEYPFSFFKDSILSWNAQQPRHLLVAASSQPFPIAFILERHIWGPKQIVDRFDAHIDRSTSDRHNISIVIW